MHTALAICPHADDAAAFFGGALTKFADEGWRTILVRVTDDAKDSVGLTIEETTRRNTEQLHEAARIMGVSEVVELGYATDCMGDISGPELRERFVYLFRKYRPYAVFTFDPFGLYENNMDHVVTAQAVDEAFWVSCFDLHYPEHFKEGLEPFSVCERWYYGRDLPGANHAVDTSGTIERKIDALAAHDLMMRHLIHQLRMQARTWGHTVPRLDEAFSGDIRPLLSTWLHAKADAEAQRFQLPAGGKAECFRLSRFGTFEEMFQALAVPIPGAPAPPHRPGLDVRVPRTG